MNVPLVVSVCLVAVVGMGCSLRQNPVIPGDGGVDIRDTSISNVLTPDAPDRPAATGGAIGAAGGNATGGGGGGMNGGGGAAGDDGPVTPGVVGVGAPDAGAASADAPNGGALGTRDLGVACTTPSDCASGNCVDGVCCNTACTGSCSACNLKDFAGTCSPVPGGMAPAAAHPACPKMPASTCKQNGLCDGKGTCQVFASGETCGGGTCSASTQMAVTGSTCDGLGTCKPAAALACAPFKCKGDGTGCATTCTADSDCQGQPCVMGSCGRVPNASKCTAASQCVSGNCVDGLCCDTACTGSCQACDLAGALGKCTALAADQAPRNGRAACAAGTCGSRCNGTSTSCVFAPNTTPCGAARCTAGMLTAAVTCNGMGTCPTAAVTSCGGFACSGSACKTTCAADTDCVAPTPFCSGGKCQTTKPLGRACTAGSECAGGNCVNGVCCSTASCGTCQACNLNGAGTCSNKPAAATDATCTTAACFTGTCNGSGACNRAADGASCGSARFCHTGVCGPCTEGTCEPANVCKTGTTSCATGVMVCTETGNKPATTTCGGATSCSGTTKTNVRLCNGSGTCAPATTQTCASGCNAAGTDCLTCPGGQAGCNGVCCGGNTPVCSAGTCVQCTSDASCSGATPSCDATRKVCTCRAKTGGNILTNPGLDGSLAGWELGGDGQGRYSPNDVDGCTASGSFSFLSIGDNVSSDCKMASPNTKYYLAYRFKALTAVPGSSGDCRISFYDQGCSNSVGESDEVISPPSDANSWVKIDGSATSPAGTGGVRVTCAGFAGYGYYDQFYLGLTAGTF